MKLGFFGGSFNPPSNVHINIAKSLVKNKIVDKVFFVPVGDYYEKDDLVSANHRFNMLKYAIEADENLDIEKIAMESKKRLFAIDTFKLIKDKYTNDDVFFIMGSDNYRKMPTWKQYEELIESFNIIVIERERKKIRENKRNNILEIIAEKTEEIDSSKIRQMIRDNKDVSTFINKNVYEYIQKNELYKK